MIILGENGKLALAEALSARDLHLTELESAKGAISELKSQIVKYQEVVADFKSAAQLKRHVKQLADFVGLYRNAAELTGHIRKQQQDIDLNQTLLSQYQVAVAGAKTVAEVQARVTYLENYLAQLKADIEEVRRGCPWSSKIEPSGSTARD